MSTKAILLVSVVFAVGVSLQIPGLLSQSRPRMNANLLDIGLSVVGFAACAVVMVIKNAKRRNFDQ